MKNRPAAYLDLSQLREKEFRKEEEQTLEYYIYEIQAELERAESKWDWEKYSLIKMAAVLAEESGEVIRATLQHEDQGGSIEEIRLELIQTGAMVLRMLKNLR